MHPKAYRGFQYRESRCSGCQKYKLGRPLTQALPERPSGSYYFLACSPLCLSLPLGYSQRHTVLGGLLICRPHTSLKFTSDHTVLHLLTRERLQNSDVFLRPRTQFRSLRHVSSLSTAVADHWSLFQKRISPESAALSLLCTLYHARYVYHVAMWITLARLKAQRHGTCGWNRLPSITCATSRQFGSHRRRNTLLSGTAVSVLLTHTSSVIGPRFQWQADIAR